jgi:hypothetical protein
LISKLKGKEERLLLLIEYLTSGKEELSGKTGIDNTCPTYEKLERSAASWIFFKANSYRNIIPWLRLMKVSRKNFVFNKLTMLPYRGSDTGSTAKITRILYQYLTML